MEDPIADRAIQLIDLAGLSAFAESGTKEYFRWQNVKRGRARVGTREIEEIGKVFPQYRWWLTTGEVMPESGQVSPEYDEANRNLSKPDAG
ncbi:DNA-binding protein [Pseudomonas sp. HMWF032]|jgi:hypothetical protein|nr:MAG: DNA-binding protein [Gammaproteobacteria bacterium HGW-Gammaproteobacteria-13]PTS83141.1 DNA-binding protein [Pseudomonas sp. HMWF032]PTT79941.1 DNA-binding protein [Pseudomonas sp. HMWF010]